MLSHIFRRLLSAIPTVIIVGSIVFFVMRFGTGDPALAVLGEAATAESIARLHAQMGLDKPLIVQYFDFLLNLARGNLGNSLMTDYPVAEQLARVLPNTIELAAWGLLIALLIGFPAGILGALYKNTVVDYGARFFALMGFSIPPFILAIFLLIVFAVNLGWFPVLSSPAGDFAQRIHYVVLPALSSGLTLSGFVARMTRSVLLEVLQEDYVRTARAKGLFEINVNVRHAFRNALIPVVTVIGLYVGVMLAGGIVIEVIFNRPGMGKLLVEAARQRDYTLIQGGLMVYALIIVAVNILVDLLYVVIDPTVRFE